MTFLKITEFQFIFGDKITRAYQRCMLIIRTPCSGHFVLPSVPGYKAFTEIEGFSLTEAPLTYKTNNCFVGDVMLNRLQVGSTKKLTFPYLKNVLKFLYLAALFIFDHIYNVL